MNYNTDVLIVVEKDVFRRNEVCCVNKTKSRTAEYPIAVNIEKLSSMLSCGQATARKIGEQAGAKIVIGRRVLYSVDKVKKYLLYLEE